MQDLIKKITQNKFAAISLIVFVLILIFALIFLFASGNQKESNINPTKGPVISPHVIVSPIPTSEVPNKSFDGIKYKISYPSSWSFNSLPVLRGGTLTQFTENIKNHEAFPRVDIQATPVSSTSATVEELVTNLAPLRLKQDSTIFHGQNAIRLSGVMPFDFVDKNSITKKVNKTFLFVELAGTRYIIDYAYYEDENREVSLNLINKILSTYQFQ